MSVDVYTLIAKVPKGSESEFRIAINENDGDRVVDLRVWVTTPYGGRRPSRVGVTIRPKRLGQVIEALQQAQAEAERRGLASGNTAEPS